MKLRCTHDSVRIRLRKSEVEHLDNTGYCTEVIHFPDQRVLTFGLFIRTVKKVEASFLDNQLHVLLPEKEAQKWIKSDQVGIETQIALSSESFLHVLVEKDFPCKDRSDEDKSDTFQDLADKSGGEAC